MRRGQVPMESFQALSIGGVKFNKPRFKSDVSLFNVRPNSSFFLTSKFSHDCGEQPSKKPNDTSTVAATSSAIPPELDFFKYDKPATASKQKPALESTLR